MHDVAGIGIGLGTLKANSIRGAPYYRARYYDQSAGRFLSQDPIGFSGGLNFYQYAASSAVNYGDPAGLWSPAAHNQIIWNALHPCGVSNADIWSIQQGSQFIDDNFQGSQWSYMHSMSDGNAKQKPLDAQKARDGFINQQIGDAKSVLGAGGESQGMFLFGMAMHPVVDQSSPAHTDPATGDPIPWCGYGGCGWFGLGQVNQHSRYDVTGIERLQDLNANPEVQQRMNKAIRNYFQGLTGQKLRCDSCN